MKKNNEFNKAAVRIILPTIVAAVLFIATMFLILIPSFEKAVMDRKREMIRELTNSAYNIIYHLNRAAETGLMPMEEAKEQAVIQLKYLRYGPENKDYFWITDETPVMIMHPYRIDLIGEDLSEFRDPKGKKLFVEFVESVKDTGDGYVDYMWQWKDDPTRIVPKLSYIKEFKPWEWIIGTGIYIEDVKLEISKLTRRLIFISLFICALISALLFYVNAVSLKIEKRRRDAEEALKKSREKYKTLVEAATDGSIMIADNKFVYANKHILDMLGYTKDEFFNLDIFDVFSDRKEYEVSFKKVKNILSGKTDNTPENLTVCLKHKNGDCVETFISFSKVAVAGRSGWILICKDISRHMTEEESRTVKEITFLIDNLQTGYLKLLIEDGSITIADANEAAVKLLGVKAKKELLSLSLTDFLADAEDKNIFTGKFEEPVRVSGRQIDMRAKSGELLQAEFFMYFYFSKDDNAAVCSCLFQNISEKKSRSDEKENLIVELQTSLLYLSQPVKNISKDPVMCSMNTKIKKAALMITRAKSSAAFITADDGAVVGIVSDFDFRARAAAEGVDIEAPVFEIMSAPVASINGDAPIFEALLVMQEKGIKHLGVKDSGGKINEIVCNDDLLKTVRHTSSFIINEIKEAQDIITIKECADKTPAFIKSLIDSGANAQNVTGIITKISDAIVNKLIDFAIEELGEPPCKFGFLVMGSEGRKEQTLVTDQDNAIVYEDVSGALNEKAREYFFKMGVKVCDWLNDAGYSYCKGGIMAKNPKWCKPLSQWKQYFTEWITNAEPENLLNTTIFFDFRQAYGSADFAAELKAVINKNSSQNGLFFYHLANNALLAKPPISFFGKIRASEAEGKPEALNIKHSLLPIVDFARLYALKNNLEETATLERLRALYEKNIIRKTIYSELTQSFNYLLLLRFKNQCQQLAENKTPDNFIDLNKITHIEKAMLQKIFSQVETFQTKISFDFKLNQ